MQAWRGAASGVAAALLDTGGEPYWDSASTQDSLWAVLIRLAGKTPSRFARALGGPAVRV